MGRETAALRTEKRREERQPIKNPNHEEGKRKEESRRSTAFLPNITCSLHLFRLTKQASWSSTPSCLSIHIKGTPLFN
ncbi:hypothetical protein SLA2020_251580 [Shorea laevis]